MMPSCFFVVFLMLAFQGANASTISGRVYRIIDGDSLLLVDSANRQHRVRLLGIDAPEATQAFGAHARTRLSALAFGKLATAECRRFNSGAHCMVLVEQTDIALEQLRSGMAWCAEPQASEQKAREEYEHAEFEAKVHRYGLWRGKNPIPPWDWRRSAHDN